MSSHPNIYKKMGFNLNTGNLSEVIKIEEVLAVNQTFIQKLVALTVLCCMTGELRLRQTFKF